MRRIGRIIKVSTGAPLVNWRGSLGVSNGVDGRLRKLDRLDGEDTQDSRVVLCDLENQLIGIFSIMDLNGGALEKLVVKIQTSVAVSLDITEELGCILKIQMLVINQLPKKMK